MTQPPVVNTPCTAQALQNGQIYFPVPGDNSRFYECTGIGQVGRKGSLMRGRFSSSVFVLALLGPAFVLLVLGLHLFLHDPHFVSSSGSQSSHPTYLFFLALVVGCCLNAAVVLAGVVVAALPLLVLFSFSLLFFFFFLLLLLLLLLLFLFLFSSSSSFFVLPCISQN